MTMAMATTEARLQSAGRVTMPPARQGAALTRQGAASTGLGAAPTRQGAATSRSARLTLDATETAAIDLGEVRANIRDRTVREGRLRAYRSRRID